MAYLAENSSYVSSSCWPERSFIEVLKAGRPRDHAAGACTRARGNWVALKRPEGRTARVARRKTEMGAMAKREWMGEVEAAN
jgi:hypothetical protein